jgi:hypothetical protein
MARNGGKRRLRELSTALADYKDECLQPLRSEPCGCQDGCGHDCRNRLFSHLCVRGITCRAANCRNSAEGIRDTALHVVPTESYGHGHVGVEALSEIPRGAIVAPYMGDWLKLKKGVGGRDKTYLLQSGFMVHLNSTLNGYQWNIDGSACTASRLNHVCKGGLVSPHVRLEELWHWPNPNQPDECWPVPVFVAIEKIEPNTEILWDYGGTKEDLEAVFQGPCKCRNCMNADSPN